MDFEPRTLTPGDSQSPSAEHENATTPSALFSIYQLCNTEEGSEIMVTVHNIAEYTVVLPIWFLIMFYLHSSRYIFTECTRWVIFLNKKQYQHSLRIITDWFNKRIPLLLPTLQAELDAFLAFFKDHDQHKRLQRAWASFKLWYLPLVILGIGKASESLTLRIECALVMCMIFALAQADRQERDELKAKIEELKMRLGEGECEEWSVIG